MIMELPICRVRQIVAAVTERRSTLLARERVHLEWQTKSLCAFIAQTVQSPRAAKSLLREVDRLTLFPGAEKRAAPVPSLPVSGEVDVVRAGSDAAVSSAHPVSAPPGSYERLMAGFRGGAG